MKKTKKVLWISRHTMTPEQKDALGEDVEIVQIDRTLQSAYEVKEEVEDADVIAVVGPINLQKQFLDIAGDRPVILAKSNREVIPGKNGEDSQVVFHFVKWERLKKIVVEMEDYIPE